MEEDLAATPKRWKIAFLHRSPYGSSRHGGDEKVRQDLEPIFARHKMDLVFSGHDHAYERTVPIRGVTYVVSGGGGRRLYRAGRSKRTAFSKSAHHAVLGPTHRRRTPVAGGRRSWRHGYRPLGPLAAIRQMTAWCRVSLQPLARCVGPSTQKWRAWCGNAALAAGCFGTHACLLAHHPSRCSMPCGHLGADPRNSYLCSGVMGECSAEEQGGDSTILGCTSRPAPGGEVPDLLLSAHRGRVLI